MDSGLGIEELADRTGVSVRTVRYYISQGLLPGPGTRGKGTVYGDEHLARLRLIRRLSEQHVPLAEQRERLAALSLSEIEALLRQEERQLQVVEQAQSPRDYVAALLERAKLARSGSQMSETAPPYSAATVPPSPVHAPRQQPAPSAALPVPPIPADRASEGSVRSRAPEMWQRMVLAEGVELHVRADASRKRWQLVKRLLHIARDDESASRIPPRAEAAFNEGGDPHVP